MPRSARAHRPLAPARLRLWRRTVGEIFCRRPAAPLALFMLLDREARPALRTPGPWLGRRRARYRAVRISSGCSRIISAVQLCGRRVGARPAALVDHIRSGLLCMRPVFLHAAGRSDLPHVRLAAARLAALMPPSAAPMAGSTPTLLTAASSRCIAFGPAAAMLALIAVSGRGAVTMWGYPLWLFFGLWIVLFARSRSTRARLTRDRRRLGRGVRRTRARLHRRLHGAALLDHRYRAAFFPGDAFAAA